MLAILYCLSRKLSYLVNVKLQWWKLASIGSVAPFLFYFFLSQPPKLYHRVKLALLSHTESSKVGRRFKSFICQCQERRKNPKVLRGTKIIDLFVPLLYISRDLGGGAKMHQNCLCAPLAPQFRLPWMVSHNFILSCDGRFPNNASHSQTLLPCCWSPSPLTWVELTKIRCSLKRWGARPVTPPPQYSQQ